MASKSAESDDPQIRKEPGNMAHLRTGKQIIIVMPKCVYA